MIKEIFDLKFEPHKSSGKFSISSIASCKRKKFLEMTGQYKEEYDAKTLRTFKIGDAFHKIACNEIIEKGEIIGLHVCSAEQNIPVHPFLSGRADLIVSDAKTGEMVVVDCKSCSDWTLKQVREGEVSESYIWQVQLYLHLFGLKRGYLLFYSKHKGEIEEHEILYDKGLCEKLIADIKYFMEENIAKNIEPAECNGGQWGCPVCGGKR